MSIWLDKKLQREHQKRHNPAINFLNLLLDSIGCIGMIMYGIVVAGWMILIATFFVMAIRWLYLNV